MERNVYLKKRRYLEKISFKLIYFSSCIFKHMFTSRVAMTRKKLGVRKSEKKLLSRSLEIRGKFISCQEYCVQNTIHAVSLKWTNYLTFYIFVYDTDIHYEQNQLRSTAWFKLMVHGVRNNSREKTVKCNNWSQDFVNITPVFTVNKGIIPYRDMSIRIVRRKEPKHQILDHYQNSCWGNDDWWLSFYWKASDFN